MDDKTDMKDLDSWFGRFFTDTVMRSMKDDKINNDRYDDR